MSQNNNQESTIRTLGIVSLAVIVFALLYNSLLGGPRGFGFQMSYGGGHGIGHGFGYGMGYGYGPGSFTDINGILASLLVLAVKLLWVVFIVTLLAGLVILIKKYIDENKVDLSFITKVCKTGCNCPSCGIKISPEYKYCPGCKSSLKETCAGCGRELIFSWNSCPYCGKERVIVASQQVNVEQQVPDDQQVQDNQQIQVENSQRPTGTRPSTEDDSIWTGV